MSGFTITYSRALRRRRLREGGGCRRDRHAHWPARDEDQDAASRRGHDPQRHRDRERRLNYSRDAENGVYVHTTVTIGYDAPWRQVRALLLAAAERTPGIRSDPKPEVRPGSAPGLLRRVPAAGVPGRAPPAELLLDALHANILDAFNEAGVQIMSPHYETDPHAPKLVSRADWQGIKPPADPDQPETSRGKTKSAAP